MADALSAPLLALSIGDIRKLGLRRQPYGPMEQIRRDGRIPLIDVGTLRLIREGKIALAPGLERFTPTEAVFEGGLTQPFDAVVFATGYRPALEAFLPLARDFCDARGFPKLPLALPEGLHLCGFDLSTRGMLKEISIEAKHLAAQIASAPAPRQLAS
ncbi:MAG: hypothetical protein IPJ65_17235 [Archangiaceae bacterium]|nr:hypothetical protein [Archangiaceae bacterium]